MAKRRKEFTFLVTVTAPATVDAGWSGSRRLRTAEVAREVRTLINEQCFYSSLLDEGDIKVRRIRLAKAER